MIKGDTLEDMLLYLRFRKKHLELECQKLPFVIKPKQKIEKAQIRMAGKIAVLTKAIDVMSNNIKEASKFEFSKAKHLKELKDKKVKEAQKDE